METDTKKRYVSWQIFVWAIGIITVVIGWCFVAQANTSEKVDKYNQQLLEIRTQLSQIQTDLQWIKEDARK